MGIKKKNKDVGNDGREVEMEEENSDMSDAGFSERTVAHKHLKGCRSSFIKQRRLSH